MNSPDLTSATLGKLTRVFTEYPELTEVMLFGSRVTGKASSHSDIDLATRGIVDHQRLGRLDLDLDDADIPQKCDIKAYEDIRYAPLRTHIDAFGITIYRRCSTESKTVPQSGAAGKQPTED